MFYASIQHVTCACVKISGSRGLCVIYESLTYCTNMTLSAGFLYISNK